MKKLESLLESRLSSSESKEKTLKVRSLAERSNSGQLSGYSTLLAATSLSSAEKEALYNLLLLHKTKSQQEISEEFFQRDLEELSHITQEVRSITQQSILLHGERIQKAQKLLSSYTDGAFSSWLLTVYGNRQTPYNFLLYYQLYTALEDSIRRKMETFPKQAVYTLAGRDAPLPEKIEFIRSFHGSTKQEFLEEIRRRFPLSETDKRKASSLGIKLLRDIKKVTLSIVTQKDELAAHEKSALKKEIKELLSLLSS